MFEKLHYKFVQLLQYAFVTSYFCSIVMYTFVYMDISVFVFVYVFLCVSVDALTKMLRHSQ